MHSFYPTAHIAVFWTTIMETSYLYRIASKTPKLFRSGEWWWRHDIWYRRCKLYHLIVFVKIIV